MRLLLPLICALGLMSCDVPIEPAPRDVVEASAGTANSGVPLQAIILGAIVFVVAGR